MSGKSVNFDHKKIKKSELYKNKKVTEIDKIAVNKILVSKEEPYGTKNSFKYFIGYNDNVIRAICIKLPQMTGYVKKFKYNLTMSFKISDKELLKKYDYIWKSIEKLLKKQFDSKPVYGVDEKHIKTKQTVIVLLQIFITKKFQKKKHHASIYQ